MRDELFPYDVYEQKFSVSYDYPVCFARNVFADGNPLLASIIDRKGETRRHRVMVYVDSGVAGATPNIGRRIKTYFHAHSDRLLLEAPPQIVAGGEAAKTGLDGARDVMAALGRNRMCRQSFVVVVGGGGVLDMVGFAASLAHRGLRVVRLPTTVLAQNDAGVGVKTGMNQLGAKNFAGTFAPPFAVINDFEFLETLDTTNWIGGISEAFKVAITKDAKFFDFLCRNARGLRNRDMAAMETLIRRCATIHLDHIRTSGDPFEFGSSRPLDFGHWSAHRIEIMSGHEIGHGQAVAIGIAIDCRYAMKKGLITESEFNAVMRGLVDCGLPVWSDVLDRRDSEGRFELLKGLEQFREHLGGELAITLPRSIGGETEAAEMDASIIEESVEFLREFARAG